MLPSTRKTVKWKFHWIALRKNCRKPYGRKKGIEESTRKKGFVNFTLEVFYIDFPEPRNPSTAPFVLQTQDQLEL